MESCNKNRLKDMESYNKMTDSVSIISHLLTDDILPIIRTYARPVNPMNYALQCEFSWRHNADIAEEASTIGHNRFDGRYTIRECIAELDL